MSKQEILSRVSSSLRQNAIPSHSVKYENPMIITQDSLLQEYKLNQQNNKTIIIESSLDFLSSSVNEILKQCNAKKVLCNMDLSLDLGSLSAEFSIISYTDVIDNVRDELFEIDTSIVEARCGVANLGIVGLSSNSLAPRLSSLITNTCIYLLNKNHIVENLNAGIEFIKNYEKQRSGSDILPSNIIFVAGPSRTADIELQTIFGVHGPRLTYVILY